MKLSMWILADKLQRFSPRANILSEEMDISGVRPLLAGEEQREDILYVSPARVDGIFDGAPCVLCSHGADWMKLRSGDAQEVLNAVLDIFEAFQRWQEALDAAASQGGTIQSLLDVSGYALPFPIVVSDAFGKVLGYSKNYDEYGEKDVYWASVVKHQQVSKLAFSEAAYTERRTQMQDWDTTPRIYETMQSRIIGMHLTQNDEVAGTVIIIELGGTLGRGVCQLAGLLHAAVSRALSLRSDDTLLRDRMAAAEEYLDGRDADAGRLWAAVCGYTGGSGEKELILLKNLVRADLTFKNNLAYRLTTAGSGCFALAYHDYVAAVISCDREAEFFRFLWAMLRQGDYVCGVSLPFSDVRDLQNAGSQAALALLSGDGAPGSLSRCADHVYRYFLNLLAGDPGFGAQLLHPGLARLRRYDEKHGTEFYDTLYRYLLLERNVVATAKALNIHRNSMLYRLQRIRQLLDAELDDPELRMHLLLSYQLRQAAETRRGAEPGTAGGEQGARRFWAEIRERL